MFYFSRLLDLPFRSWTVRFLHASLDALSGLFPTKPFVHINVIRPACPLCWTTWRFLGAYSRYIQWSRAADFLVGAHCFYNRGWSNRAAGWVGTTYNTSIVNRAHRVFLIFICIFQESLKSVFLKHK